MINFNGHNKSKNTGIQYYYYIVKSDVNEARKSANGNAGRRYI